MDMERIARTLTQQEVADMQLYTQEKYALYDKRNKTVFVGVAELCQIPEITTDHPKFHDLELVKQPDRE